MKQDAVYESRISTARWLIYDVPGNVGWIMYLVCLILCFAKQPEYMEFPLVSIGLLVGVLPALAILIGIAELIGERISSVAASISKEKTGARTGSSGICMYLRDSLRLRLKP